MDKARKQIVITLILIIVLILVGLNSASRIKKKIAGNAAYFVPAVIKTPAAPMTNVVTLPTKGAGDLKWARDPFSGRAYSANSARQGSAELKLVGITWDNKNPMAIINNKVVEVGDSVAGNLVIQINEGSVVLNDGTRDFELKL